MTAAVGAALRAERDRRGLSQETVAAWAGISERSLRRLESGALRAATLAAVLRALRVRLVVRLEPL